jgi:hypothetical protein
MRMRCVIQLNSVEGAVCGYCWTTGGWTDHVCCVCECQELQQQSASLESQQQELHDMEAALLAKRAEREAAVSERKELWKKEAEMKSRLEQLEGGQLVQLAEKDVFTGQRVDGCTFMGWEVCILEARLHSCDAVNGRAGKDVHFLKQDYRVVML